MNAEVTDSIEYQNVFISPHYFHLKFGFVS